MTRRTAVSRWLLRAVPVALLAAPVVGAVPAHGAGVGSAEHAVTTSLVPANPPAALDGRLGDRTVLADRPTGQATNVDRAALPVAGILEGRLAPGVGSGDPGGWGLPLPVLLVGYTRQADDEPLTNAVRQRVYDHILDAPGSHIAAIVDGTDIPRSTVRYHLRVLEDAGLVASGMVRGKHRYAPDGGDLEVGAALRDESVRRILVAVAALEPAGVTEIAEEVDRSPSTVSHHLDHLTEAGLVAREGSDGAFHVSLEPEARASLRGGFDGHPRNEPVELPAE